MLYLSQKGKPKLRSKTFKIFQAGPQTIVPSQLQLNLVFTSSGASSEAGSLDLSLTVEPATIGFLIMRASFLAKCLSLTLLTNGLAAPAQQSKPGDIAVTPVLTGGEVVMGAGTYLRANFLKDGSILGVYTAFDNGNTVIRTVKSTDNGASWTALGSVSQGPTNANDIDNPYVLQLPSGRVLCAYRNHSKDPSSGAYTYFRITVSASNDNGATWKYLSQPASDPGPMTGSWEPFLRNANDGSLQIYYSRENAANDQDSLERFSTDGGATWSAASTISGAGITSRDGMTGVTTIAGNRLICVFESETTGVFSIHSITSEDDGKTWGNRQTVYTTSNPNTSAGAPQVINVGGILAVTFITNEDSGVTSPSPGYTNNVGVKLVTSGDGGATWGNKITVGQVQSIWAGVLALDQNSFLVVMDHGGAKAQKVTLN